MKQAIWSIAAATIMACMGLVLHKIDDHSPTGDHDHIACKAHDQQAKLIAQLAIQVAELEGGVMLATAAQSVYAQSTRYPQGASRYSIPTIQLC